MKKNLLTLLTILLFTSIIFAGNITPTAEVKKQYVTVNPEMSAKQGESIFKGSVSKIVFNLKTFYLKDDVTADYVTEIDLITRQTLFENFMADVYLRFLKSMSNDSGGVDIQLMHGSFQYVGTYFQLLAGRIDTTKIFSTMNFFGNYTVGGQKFVDMAGFTFPLYLTGGIPEIDEVKFPPVALSFNIIPTIFNKEHTDYNKDQTLFFCQARVNTVILNNPVQIILNGSKSITQYFINNVMSGSLSTEISASVDLYKHFQINLTGGILNTDKIGDTSAVAVGVELHNFAEWIFVLDKIIFEQQFILANNNTEISWFLAAENKISKFRYGVAASNTSNRYTLANVFTVIPTSPFGKGNTYAPENITFNNTDISNINYYIYIGYDF